MLCRVCLLNKECTWPGTERLSSELEDALFSWILTNTILWVFSIQQQNIPECFSIDFETSDIIHQVKNITWLYVHNNFGKNFHCRSSIVKLYKRLEDCLQICPISKFANRRMKTKVHSCNCTICWWIVYTWDPARRFLKKYIWHMWPRNKLHLSCTFACLLHPSLPGLL